MENTNTANPEHIILKKRLSAFRSQKGSLVKVSDDLIIDIVRAWEKWTGTSKGFYQSIGLKKEQLGSIIKKSKRLSKEGRESLGSFTPLGSVAQLPSSTCQKTPMILNLDKQKSIRFYEVDHLLEFLKKAA